MVCGDRTPVVCGVTSCKVKQPDGTCRTETPCTCQHQVGVPKGIAIAKGQILANFGWGSIGTIMNSTNGAQWVHNFSFDAGYCYPNIAFGQNSFVHFAAPTPHVSDDGLTWRNGGSAGFNLPGGGWSTPRAFNFLDNASGGAFIGVADGDVMRVSTDTGKTWKVPANIPAGCSDGIGSSEQIMTGNSIAVIVNSNGFACRSTDGGMNWSMKRITTEPLATSRAFNQGLFLVWSTSGNRYSSPDGVNWTSNPVQGGVVPGAIGVSPTGTLVSTNGLWSDYSGQAFIRSTDNGLTWSTLPAANFTKGHIIMRFGSGYINRNALCP